jgi:hypothetical protein
MSHIQSEPIAGTARAGSTLMAASGPGHSPAKAKAERHPSSHRGSQVVRRVRQRRESVTVGEYARQWAATRPHQPTTATRVASLISKHIDGTNIGSMRLAAVRPSQAQAWVSERSQVLSDLALRGFWWRFGSIFAAAVQDRSCRPAPGRGLACRAPSESESSRCLWRRCRPWLRHQHGVRQW